MNDLELFESKYPKLLDFISEMSVDVEYDSWTSTCFGYNDDYFDIEFSSDYTGGLEGYYTNVISVEVSVRTKVKDDVSDYMMLCSITIVDSLSSCTDIKLEIYEDAKHLFTSDTTSGKVNTAHNEQNNLINQGDLNMAITTRAPKTVTIIDNNKFVDDNDSVIFEVSGIFSGEDKDILLQIMAENDIPTFLAQYNESRVQVVDQEKQIQSGIAGFKLPPLKIRDLTSSEVSILIK